MNISTGATSGIEMLVEKYRNEFRCPENTNHYSPDDFKKAERKFVKMRLKGNSVH
jgi:hypothetical protein